MYSDAGFTNHESSTLIDETKCNAVIPDPNDEALVYYTNLDCRDNGLNDNEDGLVRFTQDEAACNDKSALPIDFWTNSYGAKVFEANPNIYIYVKCAGGFDAFQQQFAAGGPAFEQEQQLAHEDGAAVEVSSSGGGDSDADAEYVGAAIGIAAGVAVLAIGGFALWSRTMAPRAAAF